MPELPEVETVRRRLEPVLVGRRVASVRVLRPDVISRFSPGPRSPPCGAGISPASPPSGLRPRDLLLGATIARLDRRGKQLAFISTDDRVTVVHLGMTGQLLLSPPRHPLPVNHVHIVWRLRGARDHGEGSVRLVFRDPRRFGGVLVRLSEHDLRTQVWSRLGPDALLITTRDLRCALERSRRPVKAALLDQTVIAGVGNIYADEACFRAGVHPGAPCADLRPDLVARLAQALRSVLRGAIRAQGSTLRDYRQPNGEPGSAQLQHVVYGRAGQRCRVCGSLLLGNVIAQRTTVFCPRCQASPKLFTKGGPVGSRADARPSSRRRELTSSST